ncbi:ectoine/hydroxyectoine ABC transporter substrate-binding protein EhuB [Pseudomonas sp. RIT-PI-AD]|uniref:ectoine/hydroxyectoine ABC transporter substrate-binding protein EhuB n=1 Tax=Pseudomonas sp. RIT-PI-AD TaxID=3035294 RepID=UPI0021D9C2D4|nr:ectoine/hydroxyectoine ABC transporter substrate-binding protein EhuB [Pseudomonas sp. RIT-PI-AD]
MNQPRSSTPASRLLASLMSAAVLLGATAGAARADTLADIQKKGYVEIGIGSGGFPYAGVGADGKPTGAAPEISIAALKSMGITDVRPRVVDWGALIPGLQARRFDLVSTGMFMNKQRCSAVLFSQPDTCSAQTFMVPKGNPDKLHSFADVAANPALKITMAPGSMEVKAAKAAGVKDDQMLTNSDVQSKLKLLQSGRVNVWVDPSDTFSALGEQAAGFEVVAVEGAAVQCAGAVFRKADAAFRDAYDQALETLKASGEFQAALERYGFPVEPALQASRDEMCERD